MEQFISNETDKFLIFKSKTFTRKNATEFIEKLTLRDDDESIKKELNKCLLNPSVLKDIKNNEKAIKGRQTFIEQFLINLRNIKKEIKKNEEIERENTKKDDERVIKNGSFGPKIKINDQNFPSLSSVELIQKAKKKYVILDQHYKNKLEPGIKKCFCYGSRHPLVGNCLNCGRIMCLQEGENNCIDCGEKLVKKENYKKNIVYDNDAKQAFFHKEKLLEFQQQINEKLQIIDDFNDWYEVSNNTWLPLKVREEARKKVENEDKF
jgi:hypothetical protein